MRKTQSWLNKSPHTRANTCKPPKPETLEKWARQKAKNGLTTDREMGTVRYANPKP